MMTGTFASDSPSFSARPVAIFRGVAAVFIAFALIAVVTGCYASMRVSGSGPRHTVEERRTTTTTYRSDGSISSRTTVTTTSRGWVYYPEVHAYYNPNAGVYYYYYDGTWMKSRQLPRSLRVHLGRRVELDYVGARPYVNFHLHVRNHSPRRAINISPRYVPPRTYRVPRPRQDERSSSGGSRQIDERGRR